MQSTLRKEALREVGSSRRVERTHRAGGARAVGSHKVGSRRKEEGVGTNVDGNLGTTCLDCKRNPSTN